jgi:hypothetical protein
MCSSNLLRTDLGIRPENAEAISHLVSGAEKKEASMTPLAPPIFNTLRIQNLKNAGKLEDAGPNFFLGHRGKP